MPTVAFHTLGCKVNQYDSQAMLECFLSEGYQAVSFEEDADVYVLNTCTVTGTGDKKSMQMARRIKRTHPNSALVLCGCLAQRKGTELLSTGASLILGTQRRMEVVALLNQALRENRQICAVQSVVSPVYEPMSITSQEEHTRAVMKIQEGCSNHCTYCIIPSVRGPIRSRLPEEIKQESRRLADAGFQEIVLTGIHLTSYGRDLKDQSISLLDAISAVHQIPGIRRIRLGSLEPNIASSDFCQALGSMEKVCPQFHLALQSGSDPVLARMSRRYNTHMYLQAVDHIRTVWPHAALTTDILTGFPGETAEEFEQTCAMIRRVGYSRIHVFPYSAREGTKAAEMPGQLSREEKESRVRALIGIGQQTSLEYRQGWVGQVSEVLLEEKRNGCWTGCTPEYLSVTLPDCPAMRRGIIVPVLLTSVTEDGMSGEPIS